ncbi:MAG TPA: DUF2071 domain-containing protein [Gemmatimonadales bacterium]|nr:DUF2071 domain-containing protein [Gemmatimonadales bacterium]
MAGPLLTAEWRCLALVQYAVDRPRLEPLVPRGTELDLWEGRALVSVVGLRFLHARLLGVPVPFHRDFDQVNFRFYVRRVVPEEGGALRRGVVFIREMVPRRILALVARWGLNEPYLVAPIRHVIDMDRALAGAPGRIRYEWHRHGRWQSLEAETEGLPAQVVPDSEAEFITERPWGYTSQRDGSCLEYHVCHPRWRVWAVRRAALDGDALPPFGAQSATPFRQPPISAFVAEGSPAAMFRPHKLREASSRTRSLL